MSFIYWHLEGWMWQPAPNQTDGLPRSTGISASRTVSLGPPRCIIFLAPLFWFSLISAQPCSCVGSAALKKFISVPRILDKNCSAELELTIFWRQHAQDARTWTQSRSRSQKSVSSMATVWLCLQKLLIRFISPICSALPPLNREVAYVVRMQKNLRGHRPLQQQSESVARRSLCNHSSDKQHPQLWQSQKPSLCKLEGQMC